MCDFVAIGAQTDLAQLRAVLCTADWDFDSDVPPRPWAREHFPSTDAVVCVTLDGCSCQLLRGLGSRGQPGNEAHLAGPGYLFRRALAATAMRFGSIRLLTYSSSGQSPADVQPHRRVTRLSQFLRCGLEPDEKFLCIIA